MALNVVGQLGESVEIVTDHAEGDIALVAEQSANALSADPLDAASALAAAVVVVDNESPAAEAVAVLRHHPAGCTRSTLMFEHALIVGQSDPVGRPQLVVQPFVRVRIAELLRSDVCAWLAVPATSLAGRLVVALNHLGAAARAHLHIAMLPYSSVRNTEAR